MKLNIIPSVIILALSAFIGYAVFAVAGSDENAGVAFAVSAIALFVSLVLGYGVSYADERKGVSLRLLSTIATVLIAISQFAFALLGINLQAYIIVTGLLLLLFLLAFYGLYRAEQQ